MWVVHICSLLRCYTVANGKQSPFRKIVLLPLSGSSRPIFFDGVTPPKTRIFIIIVRTSQFTLCVSVQQTQSWRTQHSAISTAHPTQRNEYSAPNTAQTVQRIQHSAIGTAHALQRKQYSAPNIAQSVQRTQQSAISTAQRKQHSAISTAPPAQRNQYCAPSTAQSILRTHYS